MIATEQPKPAPKARRDEQFYRSGLDAAGEAKREVAHEKGKQTSRAEVRRP